MNNLWMYICKYVEHDAKFFVIWIAVCLLMACSTSPVKPNLKASEQANPASKVAIEIEGGSYIPNLSIHIAIDWKSEMTVIDSLKQSGIVKVSEENGRILSIGDVALDTKRSWGILVNDKELRQSQAMEKTVGAGDTIIVFVK